MNRIFVALERVMFGTDDSDLMIDHIVIEQTEDQRQWHADALKRAAERHGKPFTWGSRLETTDTR